mgnify:CR=1 FL=1|jgi:hypothetical protein|tara:strand:- start:497 stop:655 length:159 start_codon:yes stop_codon:yes gene_type:complete
MNDKFKRYLAYLDRIEKNRKKKIAKLKKKIAKLEKKELPTYFDFEGGFYSGY